MKFYVKFIIGQRSKSSNDKRKKVLQFAYLPIYLKRPMADKILFLKSSLGQHPNQMV